MRTASDIANPSNLSYSDEAASRVHLSSFVASTHKESPSDMRSTINTDDDRYRVADMSPRVRRHCNIRAAQRMQELERAYFARLRFLKATQRQQVTC